MGPLDNANEARTPTRKFHHQECPLIFSTCFERIYHFVRENLNFQFERAPIQNKLYSAFVHTNNIWNYTQTILYSDNANDILIISRTQLLSEAVTQIFLTIALYRLYLLLVYIGRKKVTKTPPLILRVGPCCCWPCLPFPNLEMTDANLSWLRLLVLQLPIIQVISSFPPWLFTLVLGTVLVS